MRVRLVATALLAGLIACEPPLPTTPGCSDDTRCASDQRCDLATARCVALDAGNDSDAASLDTGARDRALVDTAARDMGAGLDSALLDGSQETDATAAQDGGSAGDSSSTDLASAADQRPQFYASAGEDQLVARHASVVLSAAGSALPAGASIAYAWTLDVAPSGSTVVLAGADLSACSFVADDAHGHYEVGLQVHVDGVPLPVDSVSVDVQNAAPVASAGSDRGVYQGQAVQLDGSASHDDDGDDLTWTWTIVSGGGSLDDANSPSPWYTSAAGYCGSASLQLTVDDGHGGADADEVEVVVSSNLPPQIGTLLDVAVSHACAGAPLRCGALADLEATVSEPEGESVDVLWELMACPGGAAVAGACPDAGPTPWLVDATATTSHLVLDEEPGVSLAGVYTLRLTATDESGHSATATLHVTVQNTAPTGQGGTTSAPHLYETGSYVCQVEFDSTLADADGDPLDVSYSVSPQAGSVTPGLPGVGLFRVTAATPSPALLGPFTITVNVDDGQGSGVQLTQLVSCTDQAPTLTALQDGTAAGHSFDRALWLYEGRALLHGQVDDEDGDPVTCTWSAANPVSGVLYDDLPRTTSAIRTFPSAVDLDAVFTSSTPAVVGSHAIQLSCSDGWHAVVVEATVTFTNRTPWVGFMDPDDVDHSYVGGGSPYRAVFRAVAVPSDSDGDPVAITWSLESPASGVALTPTVVSVDPDFFIETTDLAVQGSANVIGVHTLRATACDGIATIPGVQQQVRAFNRQPTVSVLPSISPSSRTTSASCRGFKTTCSGKCSVSGPVSYATTYSAQFADPDGDPLVIGLAVSGTENHAKVDGTSLAKSFTVSSPASFSTTVELASNLKLDLCLANTNNFTFTCDGTYRRDHGYISTTLTDALGLGPATTFPVLDFHVGSTNWVTCN